MNILVAFSSILVIYTCIVITEYIVNHPDIRTLPPDIASLLKYLSTPIIENGNFRTILSLELTSRLSLAEFQDEGESSVPLSPSALYYLLPCPPSPGADVPPVPQAHSAMKKAKTLNCVLCRGLVAYTKEDRERSGACFAIGQIISIDLLDLFLDYQYPFLISFIYILS